MEDSCTHLENECKQIEDDSKITADTHFKIAKIARYKTCITKGIPAVLSAVSGIAILSGAPDWLAWLALISSAIFAVETVIDFDKEYIDQVTAGKRYTTLKHQARSLYETFQHEFDRSTFIVWVAMLREKYNTISESTPMTDDKKFEESRNKVKKGRHEPDFKSET